MKVCLVLAALLAMPSAALAHSGVLLNTVVNYLAVILAVFPILVKVFFKLIQTVRTFLIKKHD